MSLPIGTPVLITSGNATNLTGIVFKNDGKSHCILIDDPAKFKGRKHWWVQASQLEVLDGTFIRDPNLAFLIKNLRR